ncbi:MAG: hypothetical protein Fur0034_19420 [Desulfuromonadia bacterium]
MIRRTSLRVRIGMALVFCTILVGGVMTLYLYGAFRSALTEEVKKRGGAIAHGVQRVAITPLITENFVTLSLLLDDVSRSEKGIRYIFVVDRHGHPVSHTFGERFPDDLLRKTAPPRPGVLHIETGEGLIHDIAVPIMNGDLGVIHVGMDGEAPRREVAGIIWWLFSGVLAIAIVSLLIGWWIARSLTRPLDDLHQGVLKIAEGDFSVRINDKGGDEISLLAADFNAMAENLSTYHRMLAAENETSRRLAAELSRLNTDLEQIVAERTRSLEESNRDLESFCYSVSHDLIAPLRHINAFAQMLEEDYGSRLDEQGGGYLHRIKNGARRMAALIDDLLQLSRVGRQELDLRRVDLSSMAHGIVARLRESDPARRVTVTIAEGMTAEGDPRLLPLLLCNLLENAWKYTGKREDGVIGFGCREERGERIFFVRDNGIGFDMAHLDKLFGVFQRLVPETEFPGTGIGLAIAHRVVTRHGGWIRAEGKPGEGACFSFTLGRGGNPGGES